MSTKADHSFPANGEPPRKEQSAVQTAAFPHSNPGMTFDPLLMPLIGELFEVNKRLAIFRQLVDLSIDQIRELYKSVTLIGRKKATVLLDMSESQFDRYVRDGKLENIHINRRTRVSLEDLEGLIAARRVHGRPGRSAAHQTKAGGRYAVTSSKTKQKKKVQTEKRCVSDKRVKPSPKN